MDISRKNFLLYGTATLSVLGFSLYALNELFFLLIFFPPLIFLLILCLTFFPLFLAQSGKLAKDKIAVGISVVLLVLTYFFSPAMSSSGNALGDAAGGEISIVLAMCTFSFILYYVLSRYIAIIPTTVFLILFTIECAVMIYFGLPFLFM